VPKGSLLALGYALGVLVVALVVAVWRRETHWALYAAAYFAGAEVFWRMSRAGVFYEFGKYAICLLLLVGLLRQGRTRLPAAPVTYFCLLVPAALATLLSFEWSTSRSLVSQNLSGPFVLLVCALYCHRIIIRRPQVITTMIALVLPLTTVAMYAARGVASSYIDWRKASNFDASGGFGPNQVSAMLGLGALAALIIIVLSRPLWLRIFSGGLLLWFLSQAALTFSRTGIYLVGLSSVALGVFLLRDRRTRMRFLLGAIFAGLLATFVIYPALDSMTDNKLSQRFSEAKLSGRSEIASTDIEIWKSHWLLGTGVGQAKFGRADFGFENTAAHTEYTRLLAEHGLLGLTALFLLVGFVGLNFLRQQKTGRAFAAGILVWALAFMMVSAMRLAIPAFLVGLSFARLKLENDSRSPARRRIAVPATARLFAPAGG